VNAIRTFSHIASAAILAVSAAGLGAQELSRYALDIVNPGDDAAVLDDNGDVSVRATVVPDLAASDRVELLLDGLAVAPPASTLEFPLSGIGPGQHVLQARIIDSTGNVGSISPPSIFRLREPAHASGK
jgi:hypothetical protein